MSNRNLAAVAPQILGVLLSTPRSPATSIVEFLLSATAVESAKSFMSFWPAIIALGGYRISTSTTVKVTDAPCPAMTSCG